MVYRNIVTWPTWVTGFLHQEVATTCHTLSFQSERSLNSNSGKMVLWDMSPPPSQALDFLNKVAIPCPNTLSLDLLAYHAVRSMSLDSGTVPGCNQAKCGQESLLRELFSLRGSVWEMHRPYGSHWNVSRAQKAYLPCGCLPNTLPHVEALTWFLECMEQIQSPYYGTEDLPGPSASGPNFISSHSLYLLPSPNYTLTISEDALHLKYIICPWVFKSLSPYQSDHVLFKIQHFWE